jgi:hypothetical protein
VTSTTNPTDRYPLLAGNAYTEPSVFQPENLLREARRQKQLPDIPSGPATTPTCGSPNCPHPAATRNYSSSVWWARR